jgi:hypothetical protein
MRLKDPRDIQLHVLRVWERPGDQAVRHPVQAEAGQGLGDLVLGQVSQQLIVGGRAVGRAIGGDPGRGRDIVAGPGLDRVQRGQ